MWGLGRLRLHGIYSSRVAHREVLEARSNYLRSYVWEENKLMQEVRTDILERVPMSLKFEFFLCFYD